MVSFTSFWTVSGTCLKASLILSTALATSPCDCANSLAILLPMAPPVIAEPANEFAMPFPLPDAPLDLSVVVLTFTFPLTLKASCNCCLIVDAVFVAVFLISFIVLLKPLVLIFLNAFCISLPLSFFWIISTAFVCTAEFILETNASII